MYTITIFRSTGRAGSVVLATTLATLYEVELPNDIDEIVDEFEGDFYEINYPEMEEEFENE